MNEWISIYDQMPPDDEYVFGTSGKDCPVFTTNFHNGEFRTPTPILYWKPLPNPPEVNDE